VTTPSPRHLDLADAEAATGAVVVIDVLRAFTTAAVAIAAGAREIELVRTVEEAWRRRDRDPEVLLMGEVDGAPIDGFDLSNSPAEVADADLAGRRIVHRTTAGTAGAVAAHRASHAVAASFVVAGATVRWLRQHEAEGVTFVITGRHADLDGDEDRALADLLAARLDGEDPAPGPFIERVARSTAGRRFVDPSLAHYPQGDLDHAVDVDRYDFALCLGRQHGRVSLRPWFGTRTAPR
jgi:2-phosphosulfolactate phosphatase